MVYEYEEFFKSSNAASTGPGALKRYPLTVFAPLFLFVILSRPRFDRLRANTGVQAFFAGVVIALAGWPVS